MESLPGDIARMITEGREEDVVNYLASAACAKNNGEWKQKLEEYLVLAAKHEQPVIMKHLLEAGANSGQGYTPKSMSQDPVLNAMFRNGDVVALDIFFEQVKGTALSTSVSQWTDVLTAAVESKQPEMVKRTWSLLQELNIDIPRDKGRSFWRSPLHTLVDSFDDTKDFSSRVEEIMDFLVNRGFDVNGTDYFEYTPLHVAAREGNMAGIRALMKYGADLFVQNQSGDYPWLTACYSGHYDIMQEVLQDISYAENGEILESFLHEACMDGWQPAVQYLLDKGVDVNCTDDDNRAPLVIAAHHQSVDVVQYLVKHSDCDVNFNNGAAMRSALRSICSRREDDREMDISKGKQIVKYLVQAGADVNIRDENDHTFLMAYEMYGDKHCRDLLIQHGGDVNAVARDGRSVLWMAVCCNVTLPRGTQSTQEEMFGLELSVLGDLLEQNIDMSLSRQQHSDQTPLQAAFLRHRHTLCNILLDADCSLYGMRAFICGNRWSLNEDMKKVRARVLQTCDEPYALKAQARLAVLRAIGPGNLRDHLHRIHCSRLLPKTLVHYLGKTIKCNLDSS